MPNSGTFPLISIIVPVYNVELYLDRCIESLVSQTYENLEIILVDDGSTDACSTMCDGWSKKDQRVVVVHKKNGGAADARNVGLEIVHGDYVMFVDSDDWVSSQYVFYLYKGLSNSGADICECEVLKTKNLQITQNTQSYSDLVCYDTETAMKLLIQDSVLHQYPVNKIYKKECIGNIRFVKGKLIDDEFWTYQVFGQAKKIAKISNVLYYYFQGNVSIMRSPFSLKRLDALDAKLARLKYVEVRFPRLMDVAKWNLWSSCIYAMQQSIQYLSVNERKIAQQKIEKTLLQIQPIQCAHGISIKQRIWFYFSKISLNFTCRLRNFLKVGL